MRVVQLTALCAMVVSRLSFGAEIDARSSSFLISGPELSNPARSTQSYTSLYERASLSVRKISAPGLDDASVIIDGWASHVPNGMTLDGDVNVAYLDALTAERHVRLRLGRQLMVGGSTRMLALDGASVEARGAGGVSVSAFVGSPVVRRFSNFDHGDFATGARLAWSPTLNAQLGVSWTEITAQSAVVRQDAGAEGRWHIAPRWTLTGAAIWSMAESRLAEFDGLVRWLAATNLEVAAGYRRTAPDLFLPRNSIFSVFADTSRDDVGGTVTWSPTHGLALVGDGHALWINEKAGYDAGLRCNLKPFRSNDTTLTVQARRLAIPANGYTQGRVAGRHVLPSGLGLSLDVDYYRLDQAVRGQLNSLSWSASATYNVSPTWMLGVGCMGGSTPFFERNTEVMAKLTYVAPEVHR